MIYFDQTASTLPFSEVLDLYQEISCRNYANPAAIHRLGYYSEQVIAQAKKDLADVLKCNADNLYFTSGATESINTALRGYLNAHSKAGNEIITWDIEHKATLNTFKHLEANGYKAHYLSTDSDFLPNLNELAELLNKNTALISISAVNNEIGSKPDLPKIVHMRNSLAPQAIIHVDAVQTWLKQPFSPTSLGIDLASFSGHKVHAPKGVGLLYIKKGLKIEPLLYGGGQQNGLRSGTENPVLCACLARAAQLMSSNMKKRSDYVQKLHESLREKLAKTNLEYTVNLPKVYSPYIFNISFIGVNPETLAHALAAKEIYVATHSACASSNNRSHVLDALPISNERQVSALRISLSPEHSEDDLNTLVGALTEIIPALKKL